MKIGVISDTHGNLSGWEQAWEVALGDADMIVHCGDLFYHGPKFRPVEGYDPRALAQAMNGAGKPVLVAKGNGDSEVDQLVVDFPIQQPYLLAQVEGRRILATHGHLMEMEQLEGLCESWGIDFLLTGHTHVPVVRTIGRCTHMNPGTPTYPLHTDEARRRPTCGIIEGAVARVIDLRSGDALTEAEMV